MIIRKVELKNIKSYKDATIDFEEGITSLYGLNGAGKSTILEAIGFTLFDFSPPYNQSEFVRKGEKTGEIVVTFTGTDGIIYTVTRKCGTSPSYSIVDDKGIMLKDKEDVSAKLCEILGYNVQDIGQLSTLFENAVGVPQGTFVSEFLGSQSKRKPIFDPLMRIDEYNRAYENLLKLKNCVKDNLNAIDIEISRIASKVEDKEIKENERARLIKDEADIEAELENKNLLLENIKAQKSGMDSQELTLKELERKQEIARSDLRNKTAILERHKSEMSRAAEAKDMIAQHEPGHRQFLEKSTALEALNAKKIEKDKINQALNVLKISLEGLNVKIAGIERDLKDMQKLEDEIKGLEPLIAEQEKLEDDQRRLAADISAKFREKQQLLEKKKGLEGATGNQCPLMPGVECKSVSDLPTYFDKEIKRLDIEILGLEKENIEISSNLKRLGDPKVAIGVKREALKRREKLSIERESVAREISKKSPEKEKLESILKKYERLEEDIKAINDKLRSLKPAHEGYQQYMKIADTYEQRKREADAALKALEKANSELGVIDEALESARKTYDKAAHEHIKSECDKINAGLASMKARLEEKKGGLRKVENELAAIQKYIITLDELRNKRSKEERYGTFIERTRRNIKDAGSMVIDRYLRFISVEATRLYQEIAGDNRIEIQWNKDYDIILIEDGRERSFKQLSGGEQMTASLAVRLAIIKALMNSEIVFLDEPTQNLDESRRERLAQEIMRIKDFRQMVIISHDDTFNASLENVIEIEKVNGESRVRGRPGHVRPQATLS